MAPTYTVDGTNPTYNLGNASRFVRYKRDGLFGYIAIWDPPTVSPTTGETFSGARPVLFHEAGGARRLATDYAFNSSIAGVFTDDLGAYVVIIGVPLGGLDFPENEEYDSLVHPESIADSALAAMFVRANVENPDVCGSTFTMHSEPQHWMIFTDSGGAWHNLNSQLTPLGEYADLADALSVRGDGFRYSHDHRIGKFYYFEGQNRISTRSSYKVDAALDSGGGNPDSTYLTNGATAAGANALVVDGDTAILYRGNHLSVQSATPYLTNGSTADGATSVAVDTGTAAIPAGCFVRFGGGAVDPAWHLVSEDFAGGSGTLKIVGDAIDSTVPGTPIPDNSAIEVRFDHAVATTYAGGSGSVSIKPSAQYPYADNSTIVFLHPSQEAQGNDDQYWANGYVYRSSDGWVWDSDHHTGRGFPIERKRQADVDYRVHESNPRVQEMSLLIVQPATDEMMRVDTLDGDRSFWHGMPKEPTGNTTAQVEAYIDCVDSELHGAMDAARLAHQWHLLGGDVTAYLGDRRANPSGTNVNLPWLFGRRAAVTDAIIKAWALNDDRRGGGIQ